MYYRPKRQASLTPNGHSSRFAPRSAVGTKCPNSRLAPRSQTGGERKFAAFSQFSTDRCKQTWDQLNCRDSRVIFCHMDYWFFQILTKSGSSAEVAYDAFRIADVDSPN